MLDVVDAATGAVTTLLRLPASPDAAHAAADVIGAALDGHGRVAWAVSRCEQTTIATGAVTDAPQTVAPAVCAGPRIVSRTLTADRRGRFTAGVVCGRACSGTLRTYVARRRYQTFSTRFRLRGVGAGPARPGPPPRPLARAAAPDRQGARSPCTSTARTASPSNAYILRLRR